MKIVVLSGSPRENGNSVALVNAFTKGATEAGHTVEIIDCAKINVAPMRFDPPLADDDFTAIGKQIVQADCLVFATPLYWYSWPAQIKSILDRFFAFCNSQSPIAGKSCALMACCSERDSSAFQGLEYSYDQSVSYLGWHSVGKVLVPGVTKATDYEWTDAVARATALAEQF